ncbi:MAG: aminotransferase class I/II-fold pyridoxal phosphate-dependent enzyme [Bacteroidota bacterium]
MNIQELSALAQAYDVNQFRSIGHQFIEMMASHLEKAEKGEGAKVIPYRSPEEEFSFWQHDFETNQRGSAMDLFQKVLDHSTYVHHPNCMGHQIAVPALTASFAGMMSDILANGTGVFEMGMSSNGLERLICEFMAKAIGFDEKAGGFMTSGGTLANLTSLLAARKAKSPTNVWDEGHAEKLAVMVSEEAHYCIDRAARIMGMGSEGIIKVPVDDQFKIRIDLLEEYYQRAFEKGQTVIALIGCASSTATGSYDDLQALGQFAQEKDLWYHVDGAHGGGVVFSEQYGYLGKGMEMADSVVIDFHKMLMSPALTTALIFKRGADAYKTFQQKAQYLWDSEQSLEWYNSGKRTFECTKLMMSIKVYSILRTHGSQVFRENIDLLYNKARRFAQIVKDRTDFELAIDPEANIINYRYILCPEEDRNALNTRIRQQLVEEGDFYIVQTTINGKKYLRSSIMNPRTEEEHFVALLDRLASLA